MQTVTPKLNQRNRISSIDSLRGLAALTIVLYHARSMFWVGIGQTWNKYGLSFDFNAWMGYATAPLAFGGLAVGLFFVISGYCIHRRGARNLANDPKTRMNLKTYFLKRLWRIYPTYVAALCVTAVVDYYVKHHSSITLSVSQDNSLATFIVSLLSLQGILTPVFGHNTSLWTLAIEIHFYAIYPLLYYLSSKLGAIKVLQITFVTSSLYFLLDFYFHIEALFPHKSSGGPLFLPYFFTWGFGFYLAEIEAGRASINKKHWFLGAILGILLIPIASILNSSELAMFFSTLAFGYFLYWSIQQQGRGFWNLFPGKALAALGFISYSMYVVHRPILVMCKSLIFQQQQETIWSILIILPIVIIGGWLTFMLVESRTINLPHKLLFKRS